MPRVWPALATLIGVGLASTGALALEDPMRPPAARATERVPSPAPTMPAPELTLSSTLVGGGRRVAVINDAAVGEGDYVLGAQVLEIEARAARLRYRGRELILRLGDADASAAPARGPGQ